jgi:hypothetical protein
MAVFEYSFEPWVDDRGVAHDQALVGRDAGSDAAIVALHHDWESDLHLYGYWAGGIASRPVPGTVVRRIVVTQRF